MLCHFYEQINEKYVKLVTMQRFIIFRLMIRYNLCTETLLIYLSAEEFNYQLDDSFTPLSLTVLLANTFEPITD